MSPQKRASAILVNLGLMIVMIFNATGFIDVYAAGNSSGHPKSGYQDAIETPDATETPTATGTLPVAETTTTTAAPTISIVNPTETPGLSPTEIATDTATPEEPAIKTSTAEAITLQLEATPESISPNEQTTLVWKIEGLGDPLPDGLTLEVTLPDGVTPAKQDGSWAWRNEVVKVFRQQRGYF